MVSTNHVSSKSILISWVAPIMFQPDEVLQSYDLSCSSGATAEFHMSLDPDTTSFNVTNLTSDTTYTCCVMAITKDGLSPNVCIRNSTLEDGRYLNFNAGTILGMLLVLTVQASANCCRLAWILPVISICWVS